MVSGLNNQVRASVVVEAVLLDAAGTLIRPSKPVGETYAAVARQYGAELEADKLTQAFKKVISDMPDLAFEWTSMDELRGLERDWWRELVHRVVAWTGSGIDDFDTFFETLYEHYAQGSAWQCFPEVPVVLEGLRDRGCKIAVVSNFDSRLPGILRAVGIHEYLDAVIYSSEAGSAKPDGVIFRRALAVLDVDPERAIHVGDSSRADLDGAIAAGLRGLLIRRTGVFATGIKHVIRTLDELPGRLGVRWP